MARLDIDWLGVFVEIYRTRSVSLAARQLGVAQARVSAVLGKLRRYFGDPLFTRTSRGMAPTPYADRIYPEVLRTFERLSSPERHRSSFDPATARRRFRICMTDISEIVVLPSLVNELRRGAPAVTIEAEHISGESPGRLESGDVDLAVGYMPSLEGGFYQKTLFRQDFVCLAARNHPRIRDRLTLKSFSRESHVVVSVSGTGHALVDREFARKGIDRKVVLRVPSFLGIARIVATTELLATVPRRLGEAFAEREEVSILAPPIALPTYAVKLHWHARFHTDEGNIWLRTQIARVLGA